VAVGTGVNETLVAAMADTAVYNPLYRDLLFKSLKITEKNLNFLKHGLFFPERPFQPLEKRSPVGAGFETRPYFSNGF
jgi:hypothetical protein